MKKGFTLLLPLLAVTVLWICMALKPEQKPVIHMIGDSTMANKPLDKGNPERGWGQLLPRFFNDGIEIQNHAVNGRSSRSFIAEGRWQQVLDALQPGDYVFIQFGHNDEKIADAKRYTRPGDDFDKNLRTMVSEARAKGAQPVLFNAIARRQWFENANAAAEDDLFGKGITLKHEGSSLVETHIIKRDNGTIDDYLEAPRKVAQELGVPFVDMNAISKKVIEAQGAERSKQLFCWVAPGTCEACPQGREDNTHLNVKGARMMCEATLPAICEAVPSLKPFVLTEVPYSVRMVRSEIGRLGQAMYIDFQKQLKWNYTQGLELQAMLETAANHPMADDEVQRFFTQYLDTIIAADGTINKYKKSNYTLDHINAGKMLFIAYDRKPDPRLRIAMDTLYSQLLSHPRTSEGGFWHKKVYPSQMWLDGIYMASPYYAEYAKRFLTGEEQQRAFDDVVNQFMVIARHTFDPQNNLYRHAWDESRAQQWCDKTTGQAPHVWGRALGWYTMAMVDVLDHLPEGYSGRDSILSLLRPLCTTLRDLQDKRYGSWYQVLDQGEREGNYLETSCTAMFGYTFLKGAKKGYLPKEFYQYGKEAFEGLNRYYIREDADQTISLTRICGVAGLGGNPYRSGTFDYYIGEEIRDNDPKGVGPYLFGMIILENDAYNAEGAF